jgi:RHS repeat-associated protein
LCSADGLRKSQTTATGTTLFTYDEVLVLLETDTSGNLQARNTDHPENFGGLVSQNRGGASNWYGYDSQGSTRILVSSGGLITDSYSYKVFGEPLQTGSGTINPHTYVGRLRYRQQTNGGYLLSLRLLDPFTGRFISVDPIGFDGGDWNLYPYVGNNPLINVDPSGMDPCVDACTLAFLVKAQYVSIVYEMCLYLCENGVWQPSRSCRPARRQFPPPKPTVQPWPAPYGQYCGPQKVAGQGWGIDQLDHCCNKHDACFTRNHCTMTNQFSPQMRGACIKCSQDLCKCTTSNPMCLDHESVEDTVFCLIALGITRDYACIAGRM